jgi:hypothetical protein
MSRRVELKIPENFDLGCHGGLIGSRTENSEGIKYDRVEEKV